MNKKNTVYLFPGQGAQYQGMALDFLSAEITGVRELFEISSDICKVDMKSLLKESGAEKLKRTDISQPAVTLANLCAAAALKESGFAPLACAGFSLGEYAALVCAGVLSPAGCFELVRFRGEAMQKSAVRLANAGGAAPGMAAVLGIAPDKAEALIEEWRSAGLKDLYPANINSPRQLVVSGSAEALALAEEKFKAAGARRVVRLAVAGPFHSPLIEEAAREFSVHINNADFKDPTLPLYSNVTGKIVKSGAELKELALKQVTSPVRWLEEEAALAAAGGFEACIEAGPGKVLQGLWRDTGSEIPCFCAGTLEEIRKIELSI